MRARPATHADIPHMVELLLAMKRRSAYSMIPHDLERVRATIRRCLSGNQGYAAVVDGRDKPGAVLLGLADQLWWGPRRYTSDIAYFSVLPGAGVLLVRDFIDWSWKQRGVIEVLMGQTSSIEIDETGAFFRAMGFERAGNIHRMSRYDDESATKERAA